MGSPGPTRRQGDLADMVEMLLDKGVVINADIAVSIGDTELLGVQVRAALASFETAAQYGLEFPEGTDMDRVEAAASGENRHRIRGGSRADLDTDADADDRSGSGGGGTSTPDGTTHVAVRPHAVDDETDTEDTDDAED